MDGQGAEACSGRGRTRRRGYGFIVDVAIMAVEGGDGHCCDLEGEEEELLILTRDVGSGLGTTAGIRRASDGRRLYLK